MLKQQAAFPPSSKVSIADYKCHPLIEWRRKKEFTLELERKGILRSVVVTDLKDHVNYVSFYHVYIIFWGEWKKWGANCSKVSSRKTRLSVKMDYFTPLCSWGMRSFDWLDGESQTLQTVQKLVSINHGNYSKSIILFNPLVGNNFLSCL